MTKVKTFDVERDELITKIGEEQIDEHNKVLVNLRRYDGGEIKVEIARQIRTTHEKSPWCGVWRYTRLGRMTFAEAEAVGKLLLQAAFAQVTEFTPS